MGASFLTDQLAVYASYHRDPRNRATHFIGIPAIMFSLLVPLALARFSLGGFDASAAWIVTALALAGWIALDRTIGLAMAVVVVPMLVIAEWIARNFGATTAWITCAVFFVGGLVCQFVGHAWEGRRPAFADDLFQAFIGPMFIMAEALMALGFKRELKAAVEAAKARMGERVHLPANG
jgi:uncharacterized membrane protein YGL010W